MLMPGLSFVAGLAILRNHSRFSWVSHFHDYPWEFWAIATCGAIASTGGIGDWLFHRSGVTAVGAAEHRAHILALGFGGVPLFVLMAAASISARPLVFLLPVIVVLIGTVVLICQDEFLFHRRCAARETVLHRMLTIGNGLAWLAWVHWCFVRGGGHA